MTDALARLAGVRSAIINGELVACDRNGLPDFYALHFHRDRGLCVWAFDHAFTLRLARCPNLALRPTAASRRGGRTDERRG
jgi:hypothetical protein